MSSSYSPADLNVSRETFERLEVLSALLVKWNKRINLVSNQTIPNLWERHIADSAQILSCVSLQPPTDWVDIGSGGGFPGLVIAACAPDLDVDLKMTMIESDIRKCSFLRSALREMGVPGQVVCQRIESADAQNADILSARALSDLAKLLEFSELHLRTGGTAIFPKGVNWKKEVLAAEESWSFTYEAITSNTQEGAVILKIGDIRRV
ncbi:16S rRNA (guanine(527)-N(7))-methyltransferase RsmG [Cognatishimia sp. D5M38]|uniref:Ribosomal RNA small subunit methyltransferase G n=1 Tax=Cognatishimia coralii TaxID=3083254 RepID=A0ABU8QEW7_9RHOB